MGDMNNNENNQDNLELSKDFDSLEPYDNSNTVPLPNYNKKKNKNFLALAIVAVLIIIAGTGFVFKGYITNQVMLLTKTPAEYYAYIESKGIGSGIDKITKNHATAIDLYKNTIANGIGVNTTAELKVSPEFAGLYGISDIGSIKMNANVFNKDLKQQMTTEFFYNDKSLVNLDALNNSEDESYYIQIPELSNAYLMFSMTELMNQKGLAMNKNYTSNIIQLQKALYDGGVSSDKINELLTKYTNIAIEGLNNVSQNSDATLSISDVSAKYTSLTVQLNSSELYEISHAILNAAKSDKDLQKIAVDAGVTTEEEYITSIEDAINKLESNKESILSETDAINMTVYVDNFGTIMGREFTSTENTTNVGAVGYYGIRKGSNLDYTAYIKKDGMQIAAITGDAAYAGGKLSGSADITYDDSVDTFSATLNYKDLELVGNDQYISGNMTLTSEDLNGVSLALDLIGDNDSQQMNFKMNYGNIEGVTLSIASKKIPYEDISFPAGSEDIYNANTDIYGYMSTMDVESFINHVYDVTGLDLGSMFYGLSGF
jgi:hypothetical protein